MLISIVIGTYNQKEILLKTLNSLFHQTLSPEYYEIQLVDSMSSDGTDELIESLKPPCRFNYLRVDNKGKAYARNLGIKQAKGEVIFLTDADMEAKENLLEEHFLAQQKAQQTAFEGLTINPDQQPYIKQKVKAGQNLKWSYFLTGNISIPKEVLIKAGLFDENFSGYGWEDLELGYRLSQMGLKIKYLPSAINYHNHPVSQTDMLKRKYHMGQSAAYFLKKHPNFEIKMFLGVNPLAMGVFKLLQTFPRLLKLIKNQYILEEYYYRLGLTAAMLNPKSQ